ncbi:hypothetical protein M431DRAFT_436443 [Trichoderma harzianum CBS 226.95]|uniref:Uncharacterized protein n=1 Tax=Trichoderma harzianum CBS 226.95 TaxID=983964 RepID=A0A2T4AD69_TRIHA|nr:hypothetical protein M431DRAFT_436443 [Trichoderma harzianum CBS 226.95]PTB55034.1 hypothetical protein M431DRAFT_436443 [Trichoderma harzianum CBS 226.95]
MKAQEISIFKCLPSQAIVYAWYPTSVPPSLASNVSSPNRESNPISAISTDSVTHQTIPIWRWRQKVDMLEEANDHNAILRARLLRKRNYARLAWVLSALGIWDMVNHHVNPPHSSQGLAKMEKKFSAPVFITNGHANRDPILKVEREMDHTTRYLRPCRISATPTAHHFGHFEVSLRITSIVTRPTPYETQSRFFSSSSFSSFPSHRISSLL